jgi:RNA polymerase sigma-70 factor (ECF subfamily)
VNEAEIVELCRRRDRRGQQALYALTCDRVYRVLVRLTRNPDDAFDLAQDTYLRAFQRIDQFDAASSVATWIYRIAVNEGLQFLRRRGRHLRVVGELETPQSQSAAAASDTRMDVEQALERLPDEERALLVLRYYEGLDYAEMARVLEKPPGTIGSGLNRARRLLREVLDRGGQADEESMGARHQKD